MNLEWGQNSPEAEALLRRAERLPLGPPIGARARVWQRIEVERARERKRPERRRLAWAMLATGAACAAVTAFLLGSQVNPSLTIATSTEPATMDLGGEGRVVAGPETRARLSRSGRQGNQVTLTLERGSLLAHVRPRGNKAPFVIETRAFRARVVGTVLRVVAHDDGTSTIAVGHGAVEVTPFGGPPRLVRAGERWPVASTDAPSSDELARMGDDDLEGSSSDSFAPRQAPRPIGLAQTRKDVEPDCRALAGEAAVDCWLALGESRDPVRAESALYQAGFIRMHELRDAAFALGIWERERERFPRGVLKDEAQTSIVDALVALKRTRAAEAEISDYLAAHPRGLRSAEMHFVRGTLFVADDHSCRRARHEFQLALAHPAAPWAARARAAAQRCR